MTRTRAPYRLLNAETGDPVIEVVEVASTLWTRFRGLQLRRPLPPSHGLLIVPCDSIHTLFVRFAIDVFFLSKHGTVVDVRSNVRPWRIALPRQPAHAVLETTAGCAKIEPGTPLTIDHPADAVPSRLRFLLKGNSAAVENESC